MADEVSTSTIQVVFQAVGAKPARLTVDEGTVLGKFVRDRGINPDNHIILVNIQKEAEDYVLEHNDVVYAHRQRTHG
jgi:hypothetical protein